MRVQIVLAHPLPESFAAALAQAVGETLRKAGHEPVLVDLYARDFDPRLSAAERRAYHAPDYDSGAVDDYVDLVRSCEGLVLVFPQWWFNVPAILKGWFDRVLVPGVAFAHDPEGGTIRGRLGHLRRLWVVTTTGSPWWVTELYMGHPVRRQIRRAVGAFCAPGLSFRLFCLYDMDRADAGKRAAFVARVRKAFARF